MHVVCFFLLIQKDTMPLKNIPQVISPELLYTLACMGHGDEIGRSTNKTT